jgi:hypothetical protein
MGETNECAENALLKAIETTLKVIDHMFEIMAVAEPTTEIEWSND